ncbi:hypothetical protein HOP51_15095 [Halomonas sp. MCCC 1A11036]|uniref:Toxin VasX N-terminal region domain-containing protein n=1 Tax=Billgrantia zhangzhouensis TaxID=2733481 RepID=A0ABS9AIA3_9GAMM|nr:T6SS effector BTH_I2691 family protein [Halomonas zhangzhouensis]MCE8021426.1 hypothetical protein [Halomonas zhangzhouensis]
MSDATRQQSIANCPYCQKRGLPILPLRYAITRTDSESWAPAGPALGGAFGDGVTDVALPDGQAYTLRLLRGGYLYVFNEVRGSWSGYVVTERGYLFPYISGIQHDALVRMNPDQVQGIDSLLQPPPREEEFTCALNPEHHYPGRCLTIPNADRAGNIYLAFSDTAWTKRVWHEHATNAPVGDGGLRRRDHMRKLSLAEWRGGSADHAAPLAELEERVAEAGYPWIPADMPASVSDEDSVPPPTPFGHSLAPMNGIEEQIEGLQRWADAQAEPLGMSPVMVALEDPVGIAADLAGLMNARLNDFMRQDHLQRPLAISTLIDTLQESISSQAELRHIQQRQESELQMLHMSPVHYRGMSRQEREEYQRQLERRDRLRSDNAFRKEEEAQARQRAVDRLSASDLDDAAERGWRRYRRTLEEGQPEQWRNDVYQKELQDYDRQYLTPLAEVHQTWLQSEAMVKSFTCNHDDADADSGTGYLQALLLCLQDTQQNQVCFDNYQTWLEAGTANDGNLLQRALLHNQQAVLDAIGEADLSARALSHEQWVSLIRLYNETLKHLDVAGKNLVAQLIAAVGGPLMKVLDPMIDQGIGRPLIFLGVIGEAPISVVQHRGTVSQALDVLVDMMTELNPEALQGVDTELLKRRLEIRSRGQRRQVGLEGGEQQVRMRFDRFALVQLDGEGLEPRQLANRAAGTLLEMDDWPRNQMARFRAMFGTHSRLAVIGLILEGLAAGQMAKKLDDSMAHQRTENTWRLSASAGAIIAGVGNLIHDGIRNGAQAGSIRLARMANKAWVEWMGRLSRGLGVVMAGLMAVLDLKNSIQEGLKGDLRLSGLYFFSGVAGIGAAILFTTWGASLFGLTVAAATGVGIILVLIGIGVSLLIDYFKNNALQDWMERCHFGKLVSDRYEGLRVETEKFEEAMKALGVEGEGERTNNVALGLVPQAE